MDESTHREDPRLSALFASERKKLIRLARWRLNDLSTEEAEDLVHDALLGILHRGDLIRQVEDLVGYLYRTFSNRIIDRQRRPSRTTALEAEAFEPISKEPAPDQQIMRQQLQERLLRALDKLTPQERALWIKTEIEGVSYRELAAQWNEPVGTLVSRKSRAGKRLRALLRKDGRDQNA